MKPDSVSIELRETLLTEVEADVLIATISPGGLWFGGTDDMIKKSSRHFHGMLSTNELPLDDGQMVYIAAPETGYTGVFNAVLFVVDAIKQSIGKLVLQALVEADRYRVSSVVMPLFRTGVLVGQVEGEKSVEAVMIAIAGAINTFVSRKPKHVRSIVIAHQTPGNAALLTRYLRV